MINRPTIGYGLFVFLTLLCIFYLGQNSKIEFNIAANKAEIEKRISLDINSLPLAEPLFNYAGNQQEVDNYIFQLNQQLDKNHSRVLVKKISSNLPESTDYSELRGNHKTIYVDYVVKRSHSLSTYIVVVILTLVNVFLHKRVFAKHVANRTKISNKAEVKEKPKLIIDLYSKSLLIEGNNELTSQLANKPLCFYLAMIEFCTQNPDTNLHLNKDVPDALLEIADKYFHRLAVLGHTVRKRPNFSNSLEKTLSEIRASLDEVLSDYPDLKSKLYPPRAHGEGSRSKLHSYGLKGFADTDYEVRGK